MPHTSEERYAVVSCHVERPLDDAVWDAYAGLAARRPGGFAIAALLRPPDEASGERWQPFVERAVAAGAWGPLGHHTHWTGPAHARPLPDAAAATGERVLREAAELRDHGLEPTLFCGGGWHADRAVAEACATLGYVDLTPRPTAPAYLGADDPWAQLDRPSLVAFPGLPPLRAIPTTRSIGDLTRTVLRPGGLPEPVVHVYFHDTDLLDPRRRRALVIGLRLLARRRLPLALDRADTLLVGAPEVPWERVARPVATPGGE